MYAKRIQLANYGPINRVDIEFPFEREKPKPVVLVGENGSGKSILLSHIVNGLLLSQQLAYPDTPEVEAGRVYKVRSPAYVSVGKEFSFSRVDFEGDQYVQELQLLQRKKDYSQVPGDIGEADARQAFDRMNRMDRDAFAFNLPKQVVDELFSKNCILYFPPNRFEDPAWLNEENLEAKAQYMDLKHIQGHANRSLINYSPLRDNQNWLFDVVYDWSVFERKDIVLPIAVDKGVPIQLQASVGYEGKAKRLYDIALQVAQVVMSRDGDLSLGIGRRQERVVGVIQGNQQVVHNIFQLSSGQVSVLNLFLSILRDYDLTQSALTKPEDIRGIVVVDEMDLHLHTVCQYDVLPRLMAMFPNVQFIVTSHSPLFVLGMRTTYGESGFHLYQLPEGRQVSPEDFREFGEAYHAFAVTQRHSDEVRAAVENSTKPIVFLDGETDVLYFQTAARFLELASVLEAVELRDGAGMLSNIWKGLTRHHVERDVVVLIHDPEDQRDDRKANVFRKSFPKVGGNPIDRGVENLLPRETLERARAHKSAFIDVTEEHSRTVRGQCVCIPESWMVNEDEKTNLCKWLCANGTADDFMHFRATIEMVAEIVGGST